MTNLNQTTKKTANNLQRLPKTKPITKKFKVIISWESEEGRFILNCVLSSFCGCCQAFNTKKLCLIIIQQLYLTLNVMSFTFLNYLPKVYTNTQTEIGEERRYWSQLLSTLNKKRRITKLRQRDKQRQSRSSFNFFSFELFTNMH